MTMQEPYTIYFAGHLFDHKDLAGNALLASYIDRGSRGRYQCILPQDLEQRGIGPMGIRDQDLRAVMECDLSLVQLRRGGAGFRGGCGIHVREDAGHPDGDTSDRLPA